MQLITVRFELIQEIHRLDAGSGARDVADLEQNQVDPFLVQQFAGASNHAQLKAFDVDLEEVDVVKSMFLRMSVERRDRDFDDLVCNESLTIPCDVSARQRIQSAHFLVHAKLRGSGPLGERRWEDLHSI